MNDSGMNLGFRWMHSLRLLLLVLVVSLTARARGEELYHPRALGERDVQKIYLQVLREGCRHAEREWKVSKFDPAAGYWGDGVSAGNEGIRAIAAMVLASGALLKYDTTLSDIDRRELRGKAIAGLRYLTATHVTGSQKCTNGKPWGATEKFGGESWQSGMWTGAFAFGAWLMWDELDAALQRDLARVIASENDILSHRLPPTNLWLDTKAEENGWEVPTLVLGELMFPSHVHAAAWHETALRYMMNTLCTADDLHDTSLVDGRAVNEWIHGANLQPDFTLENHNIFHPAYVACSSYFLTQAQMYYTYAHRPIPRAATHHVLDTWRMFQTIILPWGEAAYPQSMDWELHGLPYLNLFAALATHDHNPLAARMENRNLQYIRAWQWMRQGDLTVPGSQLGFTRHAVCVEQLTLGFLAHKIFGNAAHESSARAAATQTQGVWEHPYLDFIIHRTAKKFVSFSWKNRIMGQLIPIGDGHDGNPEFTVPIVNGLVGSFDLAPIGDTKTKVLEHSWKTNAAGFETIGTLLLNGGRLKQSLKLTSIGSQTFVYEDRVTALTNVTVRAEHGVPVGIENDEITGGVRLVSNQDGQNIFDFKKPRHAVALSGSWANVDSRLSAVAVTGSGLGYTQATNYSHGISVATDLLYASHSEHVKAFKTSEEVAHRVIVFYLEVSPKETAKLAKTCIIQNDSSIPTLHFKQPDSGTVEIPLL